MFLLLCNLVPLSVCGCSWFVRSKPYSLAVRNRGRKKQRMNQRARIGATIKSQRFQMQSWQTFCWIITDSIKETQPNKEKWLKKTDYVIQKFKNIKMNVNLVSWSGAQQFGRFVCSLEMNFKHLSVYLNVCDRNKALHQQNVTFAPDSTQPNSTRLPFYFIYCNIPCHFESSRLDTNTCNPSRMRFPN